ncbi:TspO/MBR family protein [Winogradskyella luteola]|uniref:Tryptophan-rich sensory protein n=1 Tax=Winogradskyella luteola TaxID=2828330 RepID=A0A9X1F5I2_9FLAO|nr:TspO/MBR family protein [Winogradskyella luteola]MBV7267722.1 tryptophan-rich sensory protein [Winogradskyella luteola]
MKKGYYFIIFLIINFGGLAIGNWFMGDAVTGEWYNNLNKAPWTPPGWVFGFAWTTIMLCFSYYLAELFIERSKVTLWFVFLFAWLLNMSWNWFFFNQKMVNVGLIVLILLTLTILYFFITFRHDRLKWAKYLLLPYLIWLCIATSLNAYILLNNYL